MTTMTDLSRRDIGNKLAFPETLLDQGRTLVASLDENRWPLGALAHEVRTAYGKHSFDAFANQIGTTGKALRGYHRVWKAFSTCVEFRDQHACLTWSHFRAVLRMKKQGLQAMLDLLTQANDNRWPAAFTEARAIDAAAGKDDPPAPRLARVCRDVPARITNMGDNLYELEFDDAAPYTPIDSGRYFVTISKEIPSEEK